MIYFIEYVLFITVLVTIGMILVRITRDPLFRRKFILKSKHKTMIGKVVSKEEVVKVTQQGRTRYNAVSGMNADKAFYYYITVKSEEMEFYFQLPHKDYLRLLENKYYKFTYYKELFYEAVQVEKPKAKDDDPFAEYN